MPGLIYVPLERGRLTRQSAPQAGQTASPLLSLPRQQPGEMSPDRQNLVCQWAEVLQGLNPGLRAGLLPLLLGGQSVQTSGQRVLLDQSVGKFGPLVTVQGLYLLTCGYSCGHRGRKLGGQQGLQLHAGQARSIPLSQRLAMTRQRSGSLGVPGQQSASLFELRQGHRRDDRGPGFRRLH
ncbi:hypothetical protein SAMN04488058_1167 [Deinococcus reticulitermitis]|uniref:Uncharacterized protein n=1 Tax=Deinococcus reticulitermitis TaxID=856736 RepID=A0A1H7BDE9_9DEIO|nr:hypothetical protein SAMN04488058_1167 [Deinococcus reticulitermitis]